MIKYLISLLMLGTSVFGLAQEPVGTESSFEYMMRRDTSLEFNINQLKWFRPDNRRLNYEVRCHYVASAYWARGEYEKAAAYYDSVDTKYLAWRGCGNGYYSELIQRKIRIAECLLKLNKADSAVRLVTSYVFDPRYSFEFDRPLEYWKILSVLYTPEQIKAELIRARDSFNISIKEMTSDDLMRGYEVIWKIDVFDTKIQHKTWVFSAKDASKLYESELSQFLHNEVFTLLDRLKYTVE